MSAGSPVSGAIVERAGPAVVVTLPDGLIVSWNAGAEALYGYSASEAIGHELSGFVPREHRAEQEALRRRALAGERRTAARVVRRRRDGREVELPVELFHMPSFMVPERRSDGPRGAGPASEVVDTLLRHLPGIVFATDLDGHVTFSRGTGLARLGLAPGEADGLNLREFIIDPVAVSLLEEMIAGKPFHGPVALSGTMWTLSCGPLVNDGERVGALGVLTASDDTWTQATSVARTQARFKALVEHSSDLVGVVDRDGVITYISPSVEDLLGWRPEEMVGRSALEFCDPDSLGALGKVIGKLRDLAAAPVGGRSYTFPTRMRHADGSWREFELLTTDYFGEDGVNGFVVNGRDVSERNQAIERLRYASRHDALTDLPNRTMLIEEADRILHDAGPADGEVAVVVIGLDRFKLVNDSLDHETGDQLLVALGNRLRAHVRMRDTVARLGGDTFAITTTGVADADAARALAGRLLAVVSEPYDLAGRRIAVTAGAGVALADGDADGTALVRNADTALYAAKRRGRGRVEVFEARLRSEATRQLTLEQSLGRATAAGELRVHFQPIMKLTDGSGRAEVSGVEALVRWQHPDLGMIPPFDFIPLAEETGHVVEIGAWVLEESCRTLMGWAGDGRPLRLAVNLSPRQLLEPDLPDVVADVLVSTGFPAANLTMEVTESVLVDEGPYATETLRRLRELGVRLSIDDFGTGYSSLVYLRRLNADALKIDRSFVDGLGRDSEADAIVNTVIGLARSLGLDLVAEGVETDDQRRLLVELGCQFAQGFLFSKPLPAPAFEAWRSAGGDLELLERA